MLNNVSSYYEYRLQPQQAYAKHPGMDSKYPLTDLQAGANEILTELGDVPMQPYVDSVGFYHAFFRYPAGQAHA